MGWMNEAGLTDPASTQAYNMLLDAILGNGNYSKETQRGIAAGHAGDVAMAGGVAPSSQAAFNTNVARDSAVSASDTSNEAKTRQAEDLALYGQTFQKGALTNDVNQMNLQEGKRALAYKKKMLKKQKYGTMLKAIGAVASVFNPAIGMAIGAVGGAVGGGGDASKATPNYKTANTSKIGVNEVASQAGSKAAGNLDPIAQPFHVVNPKPMPTNFGVRIDPLTGLPY